MYKLTKSNTSITRLSDGASIPLAAGNRDYVEYLEWVAAGNTPAPAQTPAEIAAEEVATTNAAAKAALVAIDLASMRAIREWIIAQPTAPQSLKDKESVAVLERVKLKP